MSANVYAFRFMTVSFMPAIGMGTAVTALVGRYIGKNQPKIAAHYAHLGYFFTGVYMLCCGLFFYTFRNSLMKMFTDDPLVLEAGKIMLIYVAFYQVFDGMYAIYNGALRGVGDTTIPAIAMACLCWGFNVVGARLALAYLPNLGVHGAWGMALLYGASIGLFLMLRFTFGNWKSIVPENDAVAPSTPTA
jgi:Na+-driven multidrug efflux pump